jgi:solute carrier family 25 (adenine nucleotide translocator) protein 4/5/6/31
MSFFSRYRAGQLGCFKQIQDLNPYQKDKGWKGGVSSFAAVTMARTVIMPFNYPFDTVRRRMMLQSEKPVAERLYKANLHPKKRRKKSSFSKACF